MRAVFLILGLCLSLPLQAAIDYAELDKALRAEGLKGWVHGADHDNGLYVFTYRNPQNFFENVNLPMLSRDPNVRQLFRQLNRHDEILLKGELLNDGRAPIPHVLIKAFEMVQKYQEPREDLPPYKHQTPLPEELLSQTELVGKVHAVAPGLIVLEYKDVIVPVVATAQPSIQNLYRGDKIRIRYEVRDFPGRPSHIELLADANAVQVLDEMVKQHEQPLRFCGELVMFPQSPQIVFNVFALQLPIGDELSRIYTLVNFEDPAVFRQIREKMQAFWDLHADGQQRARNYLRNPRLQVCAQGAGNVMDRSQANPQILLQGPEDIQLSYK